MVLKEDDMKRKVIATLTDDEVRMFKQVDACKRAVKEVVTAAINEYEDGILMNAELWEVTREKYYPTLSLADERRLKLDHKTNELSIAEDLEDFIEKVEKRKSRMQWLKEKVFRLKPADDAEV